MRKKLDEISKSKQKLVSGKVHWIVDLHPSAKTLCGISVAEKDIKPWSEARKRNRCPHCTKLAFKKKRHS